VVVGDVDKLIVTEFVMVEEADAVALTDDDGVIVMLEEGVSVTVVDGV